jgi:stage IV sporulation protein FB
MEDFERIYPPKPILEVKEQKNTLPATIFSLVLFIWAFYTFISDDFRFIGLIILVLAFHEAGHFLAMKKFGYKQLKMMFIPLLGAYVQGVKERYSQKQRAIVLLSGPIPGIIVGFILLQFGMDGHHFWLFYAGILFVLINVLNLFPLDPLDGGQLVQVLFIGNQDLVRLVFSLVSSLGMIGVGLYFNNYILIGFGFLLGFRVRTHQRLYEMRKNLKKEGVSYEKLYADLSDKDFFYLKEVFIEHSTTLKKFIKSGAIDDRELDNIIASEVNQVLETPSDKDIKGLNKFLFVFIWLLGLGLAFFSFYAHANGLEWFLDEFQKGG